MDFLGRRIGKAQCQAISPYLDQNADAIAMPLAFPLNAPLELRNGCLPLDGGHLIIEDADLQQFLDAEPNALPWIRPMVGARELLQSRRRWCLWLKDAPESVLHLPKIAERIERCRRFRQRAECSNPKTAMTPHLFRETPYFGRPFVLPLVASEGRMRFPMTLCPEGSVIANTCHFAPDASLYHFGIASSKMHNAWLRLVCGRLEGRLRYSMTLCWNAFPWPSASASQKEEIESLAKKVVQAREECGTSLAKMYAQMPKALEQAHRDLDSAVDALYGIPEGASDGIRIQTLFRLRKDLMQE